MSAKYSNFVRFFGSEFLAKEHTDITINIQLATMPLSINILTTRVVVRHITTQRQIAYQYYLQQRLRMLPLLPRQYQRRC